MTEGVPPAPGGSRPLGVVTPEQIRRWNLAVAVAWKLMGDDAAWREVLFLARRLFYDEGLPTD